MKSEVVSVRRSVTTRCVRHDRSATAASRSFLGDAGASGSRPRSSCSSHRRPVPGYWLEREHRRGEHVDAAPSRRRSERATGSGANMSVCEGGGKEVCDESRLLAPGYDETERRNGGERRGPYRCARGETVTSPRWMWADVIVACGQSSSGSRRGFGVVVSRWTARTPL